MAIFRVIQGCQLTPILRFLLRFSTWLPPPPISAVLLRFLRLEENVLFTACFHCQQRFRCRTALRWANPRACFKASDPHGAKGELWLARRAPSLDKQIWRPYNEGPAAKFVTIKLHRVNTVMTRHFELMSTWNIIQPYINRRQALTCESQLTWRKFASQNASLFFIRLSDGLWLVASHHWTTTHEIEPLLNSKHIYFSFR